MVLTQDEELGLANWQGLVSEQLDIAETSILALDKLLSVVEDAVILHESVNVLKASVEFVKFALTETPIVVE